MPKTLKCGPLDQLLEFVDGPLRAELAGLDDRSYRAWLEQFVLSMVDVGRSHLSDTTRSAGDERARHAALRLGLVALLSAAYCKPADFPGRPPALSFRPPVPAGPARRRPKAKATVRKKPR